MSNRTCQCGGIIRQANVPFWDVLPSCTCPNPVAVQPRTRIIITTSTSDKTIDKYTKDNWDWWAQSTEDEE